MNQRMPNITLQRTLTTGTLLARASKSPVSTSSGTVRAVEFGRWAGHLFQGLQESRGMLGHIVLGESDGVR